MVCGIGSGVVVWCVVWSRGVVVCSVVRWCCGVVCCVVCGVVRRCCGVVCCVVCGVWCDAEVLWCGVWCGVVVWYVVRQ